MTPSYPLQLFADFTAKTIKRNWIFKGVMARGETSAWIAPPGGMKSALLTEASVCAAAGMDWRGKRNKGATGVIYFALERADLVKRRLIAHREILNLPAVPLAVVSSIINLMTHKTVPQLVATVKEAESLLEMPVGLLVFDTFAKLIAAGGGDENTAKDQGAVFANIQRLKEQINVHVALVGHTGKDESKGARGSNAILGDADLMVRISGDALRTATVEKANDLPEGPLFAFRSVLHDFGNDEDGDPVRVNIVSPEFCELASVSKSPGGKLPKSADIALRALAEAIDEQGTKPPPSSYIPPGVNAVPLAVWRQQAYRRGISSSDEERAKQQAFKRAAEILVGARRVGTWDQQYWLAGDYVAN